MKRIFALLLAVVMCVSMFTLASCGKKEPIGVQVGTTGQYFVDGDEDWGFDGIKGYESKGYQNGGLAVNDLKAGVVDYVIIDEQPAKQLAKSIEGIKVIDIALTEEEYAFGVDKNQPELLEKINNILLGFKTEAGGTCMLDIIVAKYATGVGITPIESAEFDASKADKQLVVATNAAFAPFEYKEGDKFAGIDMEIAYYIAQALDMELVIMDMEFDAVVTSVGKNGVDIAMAGLTVNETRKQSVNFTDSYYKASQMLVVRADNHAFAACTKAEDVLAVLDSELDKKD